MSEEGKAREGLGAQLAQHACVVAARDHQHSVMSFIDEDVVPALIDLAAGLETAGQFLAVAARRYPLTMLALAFGAGVFTTRRRPRRVVYYPTGTRKPTPRQVARAPRKSTFMGKLGF
jgi:hypothetical protein